MTDKDRKRDTKAGHPPGLMLQNGDNIVYLDKGGLPVGLFTGIDKLKPYLYQSKDLDNSFIGHVFEDGNKFVGVPDDVRVIGISIT
jgi:hypothetical protein